MIIVFFKVIIVKGKSRATTARKTKRDKLHHIELSSKIYHLRNTTILRM